MLYWEGHACYTGRGMGGMPTQVLTYYQLRLFWRVGRLTYVPTYVLMYHSCAICVPDSCTHSMYLCAHSMYLCTHSIYFSCAPVHSPCDVPTHVHVHVHVLPSSGAALLANVPRSWRAQGWWAQGWWAQGWWAQGWWICGQWGR